MKNIIIKRFKTYFNYLISKFNFKIEEIRSTDYSLYVKYKSTRVGIYFIYEFRDSIPRIQFSKLGGEELKIRPGLYTIKELYKNEKFVLQSFYLDEILLYNYEIEYKDFFKNLKSLDEGIKISAGLISKYAIDFVLGSDKSYIELDKLFKRHVTRS